MILSNILFPENLIVRQASNPIFFTLACFVEGIGSILTGIIATGTGTITLSQNIGVLAVTKVFSLNLTALFEFPLNGD